MNDMERRKFEDAFKDAFQDAELTPAEKVWSKVERDLDKTSGDFKAAFLDAELVPTDNVWRNVELDLERAAGEKMRRRLVFYKMLAAASVTFAMCMAGVGYYAFNMRDEVLMARSNSAIEATGAGSGSTEAKNNVADAANSDATRSFDNKSIDSSDPAEQLPSGNDVAEKGGATTLASGKNGTSAEQSASLLAGNAPAVSENSTGISGNESPRTSISLASSAEKRDTARDKSTPTSEDKLLAYSSNESSPSGQSERSSEVVLNDRNAQASNTNSTARNTLSEMNGGKMANGSNVTNAAADRRNVGSIPVASTQGTSIQENGNTENTFPSAEDQAMEQYILSSQERSASSRIVVADAKVPEKPQSNADPFKLMMLQLEDEARAMNVKAKKDKNSGNEQLWTAVGMTAGTYNTVNRKVSNEIASSAVRSATSQAKASGLAYSVGLSVGTKISERWVVQGGVNYLNQISDYTSNIIVNNGGAGFNALSASNASSLKSSADGETRRDEVAMQFAQTPLFGVNSTMEFISIPVEAGYLVVNKKFGVMINAGVATDLFIQNTESANVSGAANSVQTQERGSSDSPYRDVNFTGLVGTEVSYKVGQRYRVSLTPGLRYPFNSMYKSESQIQATPVTFDVGLKFRYIFQ